MISNGQIFSMAFYGGLGIGLAAIGCIYLAKLMDTIETFGKNLYEILKIYRAHKAQAEAAKAQGAEDAGN